MKKIYILAVVAALLTLLVFGTAIYKAGENHGYDKATDAFNTIHMAQDSSDQEAAYQRGVLTGQSIERASRMR